MKRIALITGGVGGIGTAICKKLAADGLFVVANYAIPGSEPSMAYPPSTSRQAPVV